MSASVVFDPFGGPFLEDPYPQFAGFVESQPVFWSDELSYWVVSRYGDVRRVLRDYETFSAVNALAAVTPPCPAAGQALASGGFRSIPTLTNVDPPAHTRTRRIAQLAFSPRRVAQMEEFVRGLVRQFIDDRLHDGRAEIVSALTWELPALVLFDILGVPPEDVAAVKEGAANRLLFMFGRASEAEQVEIATGMASFWRYCEALAEDRRANPREDFTSDLVHTPDREGQPLTQQEVSTILFGLLLAGHETTTNILGNALRRLLEQRSSWEEIGADPSLIPNAVEEVLRFDSSVIHWRRRTSSRSSSAGCPSLPTPTSSCRSVRPTGIPKCSLSRTRSTSTGPTPTSTCRSVPVRTCASARRWPGSRLGWCSRSSPPPYPGCGSAAVSNSSSCRSSPSAARAPSTSSGSDAELEL